jgi:hypothetical protein
VSKQYRQPILWGLMQGLYYPAVLGTGLWYLIQKLLMHATMHEAITDMSNYFAVMLIVYFSISFAINQNISQKAYGIFAFGLDFVEIVLVFIAFYHIGLFKPNEPQPAKYSYFYLFLVPVPILQQIWNRAVGHTDRFLWYLSVIGVAILLFGGLYGYAYFWSNLLVVICILVLFFLYSYSLFTE